MADGTDGSDGTDTFTSQSCESKTPKTPFKRRASPLYKTVSKRGRATPKAAPKATLKNVASFYDMLTTTFKDPSFIAESGPFIQLMVAPLLKTVVKDAISTAVGELKHSILDKMVESNTQLQEIVNKQIETINYMQTTLDGQRKELQEKSETIKIMQDQIQSLTLKFDEVQSAQNDLEQYGRRNSLRISNFKFDPKQSEAELTQKVVSFVNDILLTDGPPLDIIDVERCHPIGKPGLQKSQQIIVKFYRYHTKNRVFQAKSRLKNNKDRIFMSEDLTKSNYEIVKKLIAYKKANKLNSFWTTNGSPVVKKLADSKPVRINNFKAIETVLQLD